VVLLFHKFDSFVHSHNFSPPAGPQYPWTRVSFWTAVFTGRRDGPWTRVVRVPSLTCKPVTVYWSRKFSSSWRVQ